MTCPGKCTAEGPGLSAGLVGLPASFTIYARTAEGIKRTAGGDNFVVRLVPVTPIVNGISNGVEPEESETNGATSSSSPAPQSSNGEVSHASKDDEIPKEATSEVEGDKTPKEERKSKKKKKHARERSEDSYSGSSDSEYDESEESDSMSETSSSDSEPLVVEEPIFEKPAEPVDTALHAIVVDNYDGTYSVQYTLEAAADYNIEVTLYGEQIENSPFPLNVEPDLRHEYRQMQKKLDEERLKRELAEQQVVQLTKEKTELLAQISVLQAEVKSFTKERTHFAETIHHMKLQHDGSSGALATAPAGTSRKMRDSSSRLQLEKSRDSHDDSSAASTPRTLQTRESSEDVTTPGKSEKRKSGKRHRRDGSGARSVTHSHTESGDFPSGAALGGSGAVEEPEMGSTPKESKKDRRRSKMVDIPALPLSDSGSERDGIGASSGRDSSLSLNLSSAGAQSAKEGRTPRGSKRDAEQSAAAIGSSSSSSHNPKYTRTNSTPSNPSRVKHHTPANDLNRANSDNLIETPAAGASPSETQDTVSIETKMPSFKDRFMFWFTRSKSGSSSDGSSVKKTKSKEKDAKDAKDAKEAKEKENLPKDQKEHKEMSAEKVKSREKERSRKNSELSTTSDHPKEASKDHSHKHASSSPSAPIAQSPSSSNANLEDSTKHDQSKSAKSAKEKKKEKKKLKESSRSQTPEATEESNTSTHTPRASNNAANEPLSALVEEDANQEKQDGDTHPPSTTQESHEVEEEPKPKKKKKRHHHHHADQESSTPRNDDSIVDSAPASPKPDHDDNLNTENVAEADADVAEAAPLSSRRRKDKKKKTKKTQQEEDVEDDSAPASPVYEEKPILKKLDDSYSSD